MTPTLQWSRALWAAVLLLSSVSCGPKVVVARLATPTAQAPQAAATAMPPPKPRPAVSTPLPASPLKASPRPTATPTATPAPGALASQPPPTLTPSPSPRATPAAPTALPRPSPSVTATRTQARPSPSPAATATVSITPSTSSLIGEWDFRADAGQGVIAGTLRFRAAATGIEGTYAGLRGNTTELSNLRVSGDRLSFDLVTPRAVWHLEGARSGDRIDGTFRTAERTIPWSAARKGPPAPALTPSGNPS